MDESELIEHARRVADATARGTSPDSAAEERLCRALARRIRLFGLRHLRSPERADDLVQDVLVLTLERLRRGEVRDPARLGSFVLGVCRRLVADGRRAERRRRDLETRWLPDREPVADPPALVDDVRLAHCLDALGERDRTVVRLTFVAEADPEEIARALCLGAGHVRVVRHRALARLRDCMWGAA